MLRSRQGVGLATVYRSLEILKLLGLIKSRMGANGESFYSPVTLDQHYLTCLQCGQSFPLEHCWEFGAELVVILPATAVPSAPPSSWFRAMVI